MYAHLARVADRADVGELQEPGAELPARAGGDRHLVAVPVPREEGRAAHGAERAEEAAQRGLRHLPGALEEEPETGPLSQGVQARRKALRIRHINGMEVRKKMPRGFKKRPRGVK